VKVGGEGNQLRIMSNGRLW